MLIPTTIYPIMKTFDNIDEATSRIWEIVSEIADDDPEFAKQLINLNSAPLWLRDKLTGSKMKEIADWCLECDAPATENCQHH